MGKDSHSGVYFLILFCYILWKRLRKRSQFTQTFAMCCVVILNCTTKLLHFYWNMCYVRPQTAISCFISRVIRLNFVFLQKIGCTSAIWSKLHCARFALSLQKIGCTSAIKASFIASGLHYLCKGISKHHAITAERHCRLHNGITTRIHTYHGTHPAGRIQTTSSENKTW